MSSCARNITHFLVFVLCAVALRPNLHSFGHTASLPAPPPSRSISVSSVRVCVPVRGVACLASGTACHAACRAQPVLVRWGLGSPPAGYMGRAGGGAVDTSRRKNSKKAFSTLLLPKPTPPSQNETHPIVQVSKNFKKYKKTPFGA